MTLPLDPVIERELVVRVLDADEGRCAWCGCDLVDRDPTFVCARCLDGLDGAVQPYHVPASRCCAPDRTDGPCLRETVGIGWISDDGRTRGACERPGHRVLAMAAYPERRSVAA
jgi:hypothetical protein